ncbi:MAG TPA: alpha-amylase family glycosyl hydrolase [Ignavibacteriales bacterium]|nr:alpha-amylase family glycosyl hydrolase [Ignavibacteriales bacterium]HOM64986.1 alpha-amylase family glycosyl hydrolase [Ignavibacteriales bacterium]HPD68476.1 alpha-amylase family glycosyl hydrolase [Ignavibacteriales bacterium]HRT98521.1 alpha-amylase family glycosyl hydrolase [Ignavibacteriales bacterium]
MEVNTRVWLNKFNTSKKKARLTDVPTTYWQHLVDLGFQAIWFMGIWETLPHLANQYCLEDYLIDEYSKALPDWTEEDVIGSPYAINQYKIDKNIATEEEFLEIKDKLNKLGLFVILDFIPNHFHAESILIDKYPEIFLQGDENLYKSDQNTYYLHNGKIFAHGRDPFFPAWKDTIQLNYFNPKTRDFMISQLENITKYCDGVRCDMAMLITNNIFRNTWTGALEINNFSKPQTEFWYDAINHIKKLRNDFIFIAEVYWNLEWDLQQLGFDYTYDKILLDRMHYNGAKEIIDHLKAEYSYQVKSLRFIENHDEMRSLEKFGHNKAKACAAIICTTIGGQLIYDGQIEGKKIKLPVQLKREPYEQIDLEMKVFYEKLLSITHDPTILYGDFKLLQADSIGYGDFSNINIITYIWSYNDHYFWCIINFSENSSKARIKVDLHTDYSNIILNDLINDVSYNRNAEEIKNEGLYVELKPYGMHLFKI